MKNSLISQVQRWAVMLCLGLSVQHGVAQFVEVAVEIAFDNWDYRFFEDRINKYVRSPDGSPPGIFTTNYSIKCVVGTNTWFIESAHQQGKRMYWFTGTNIIEHIVYNTVAPNPPAYVRSPRIYESVDGNPGRPARVTDLMWLGSRIAWLAFCSGSFLKHEGRKIYPPSDFWKESQLAVSGWSDQSATFKDEFGLPKTVTLLATNNQPVFRYQARGSTNVLGGNFPLEFYCLQYWPRSNLCEVDWTAKGRITSIKEGTKPEIPAEIQK